jgi:hypothetical protein
VTVVSTAAAAVAVASLPGCLPESPPFHLQHPHPHQAAASTAAVAAVAAVAVDLGC